MVHTDSTVREYLHIEDPPLGECHRVRPLHIRRADGSQDPAGDSHHLGTTAAVKQKRPAPTVNKSGPAAKPDTPSVKTTYLWVRCKATAVSCHGYRIMIGWVGTTSWRWLWYCTLACIWIRIQTRDGAETLGRWIETDAYLYPSTGRVWRSTEIRGQM